MPNHERHTWCTKEKIEYMEMEDGDGVGRVMREDEGKSSRLPGSERMDDLKTSKLGGTPDMHGHHRGHVASN